MHTHKRTNTQNVYIQCNRNIDRLKLAVCPQIPSRNGNTGGFGSDVRTTIAYYATNLLSGFNFADWGQIAYKPSNSISCQIFSPYSIIQCTYVYVPCLSLEPESQFACNGVDRERRRWGGGEKERVIKERGGERWSVKEGYRDWRQQKESAWEGGRGERGREGGGVVYTYMYTYKTT